MIHTASDSIHVEEIVLGEDGQPVASTQQRQHFQPTPAQVLSWLPKNATPEQQDSAIQANIKPSEITWSQQPDTLHLPGHSKGKSWRDVNMPKYYRESYFTGKPFFHPDMFGGRLGVAGDPVPYSIARDNVITLLLLGCFVLALIAYSKSKGFILRQAKDFFRPPHNEKMTAISETSGELRFQFFLVLQSSLLMALIFFFYVQRNITDTFIIDQYQVIGVFAAIITVYAMLKAVAYSVTGWVFFDTKRNGVWMKSWLFTLVIEGLLLYPVVMLQAYFSMDVETALLCAAVIVGVMKILAFYKAYNIFFSTRGGIVQNFLYFCTLEIAPIFILFRALVYASNFLLTIN